MRAYTAKAVTGLMGLCITLRLAVGKDTAWRRYLLHVEGVVHVTLNRNNLGEEMTS